MNLELLDLRDNRLPSFRLRDASNFLEETVVLLWNNPFLDCVHSEQVNPSHIEVHSRVTPTPESGSYQNPLHLFMPRRLALDRYLVI